MKKHQLKRKPLLLISIIVILLDQLSKFLATQLLRKGFAIPLIPNYIQFRLARNTGAAFSLFNESTALLSLLSLSVSLGILLWIYRTKSMSLWKGLGFAFLLGGSVGNGLDRWRLGYVNDFIELIPISFPIFNVADIAINIAVLCLIVENLAIQNRP